MISAIVLAAGLALLAIDEQPTCHRSETLHECAERVKQETLVPPNSLKGEFQSGASANASKVDDKASPASTAEASSGALRDFLPSFLASLGFDGIQDTDKGLSFQKRLGWKKAQPMQLLLGGIVKKPAVFEPLLSTLDGQAKKDAEDELSATLGDFDAIDLTLTATWEGELGSLLMGREYADYIGYFSAPFFEAVTAAYSGEPSLAECLGALKRTHPGFEETLRSKLGLDPNLPLPDAVKVCQLPEDTIGTELQLCAVNAGLQYARRSRNIDESLRKGGFSKLHSLINNQPQLVVEVSAQKRGDAAGPDARSFSVRFEKGFGNINSLRRWLKRQHESERAELAARFNDPDATPEYKECLAELQPTLVAPASVDRLLVENGEVSLACLNSFLDHRFKGWSADEELPTREQRLSFSLEYMDTDALHLDAEQLGIDYDLGESQKWVGKLAWGGYLNNLGGLSSRKGSDQTRFDLEASYEDVTGDPMRQSRFLATLLLTQKISKDVSLSLGAVYANRPEYRGEVDREVSARFGLKVKLDRKQASQ